jgi:hypothetical protein
MQADRPREGVASPSRPPWPQWTPWRAALAAGLVLYGVAVFAQHAGEAASWTGSLCRDPAFVGWCRLQLVSLAVIGCMPAAAVMAVGVLRGARRWLLAAVPVAVAGVLPAGWQLYGLTRAASQDERIYSAVMVQAQVSVWPGPLEAVSMLAGLVVSYGPLLVLLGTLLDAALRRRRDRLVTLP